MNISASDVAGSKQIIAGFLETEYYDGTKRTDQRRSKVPNPATCPPKWDKQRRSRITAQTSTWDTINKPHPIRAMKSEYWLNGFYPIKLVAKKRYNLTIIQNWTDSHVGLACPENNTKLVRI